MTEIAKRGGRPRKESPTRKRSGKLKKPVVSGQLEYDEGKRFDALRIRRQQMLSASDIVRIAVLRLLADDAAGNVDWAAPLPKTGPARSPAELAAIARAKLLIAGKCPLCQKDMKFVPPDTYKCDPCGVTHIPETFEPMEHKT